MSKVDLSVTRSLTINTGNYESIRPTVTLTAREVDVKNAGDVYLSLDEALTGLLKLEIVNCVSENKLVNSGLDGYCKNVLRNQEEIGEGIERSLNSLDRIQGQR